MPGPFPTEGAPWDRSKPGDKADPGAPGAGESLCPRRGSGRLAGEPCPDCVGTGTVIDPIGGA